MNNYVFYPMIDVPVLIFVLLGYGWHFYYWAKRPGVNMPAKIASRLPKAYLRLLLAIGLLGVVCWLLNFAVWAFLALLFGSILVLSIFAAMGGDTGGVFLLFAMRLIREWAFDFPDLVLDTPQASESDRNSISSKAAYLGRQGTTTSVLRPSGFANIDDREVPVVSSDGQLIESGTSVCVREIKNGRVYVVATNRQ